MKKVVYEIYSPEGYAIRSYSNRKQAKAFIEGLNFNIPSWHYDELYRMGTKVINIGTEVEAVSRRLAGTADIMPLGNLRKVH